MLRIEGRDSATTPMDYVVRITAQRDDCPIGATPDYVETEQIPPGGEGTNDGFKITNSIDYPFSIDLIAGTAPEQTGITLQGGASFHIRGTIENASSSLTYFDADSFSVVSPPTSAWLETTMRLSWPDTAPQGDSHLINLDLFAFYRGENQQYSGAVGNHSLFDEQIWLQWNPNDMAIWVSARDYRDLDEEASLPMTYDLQICSYFVYPPWANP